MLGSSVLLTTGATDDELAAGRLAERVLEARMVEVFGGGDGGDSGGGDGG